MRKDLRDRNKEATTLDTTQRIVEALQTDASLQAASPAKLAELASHARLLSFNKGEYVFTTGDDADFYYLVESGRIILTKDSPSGKVFTFMIAVRGRPLNAITCFKSGKRFFSARVAKHATVVAIPSHIFRSWALSIPEVSADILITMGDLLDSAYTRILDIIEESAETRVLNALTMLSSKIGATLPLTNTDVADITGVSRETAARIISRLQDVGLIEKSRGSIKVIDLPQLNALSTSPFFIL